MIRTPGNSCFKQAFKLIVLIGSRQSRLQVFRMSGSADPKLAPPARLGGQAESRHGKPIDDTTDSLFNSKLAK
jgi:hypothetical protein